MLAVVGELLDDYLIIPETVSRQLVVSYLFELYRCYIDEEEMEGERIVNVLKLIGVRLTEKFPAPLDATCKVCDTENS